MKLLNMIETRRPMMYEYVFDAAKKLDGVEVAEARWNGPDELDYLSVKRKIEREGPGAFDVPQGYLDNPDTSILITSWVPISAASMDAMKNLKVIGIIRAGLENIDIKAATERGILVINAGGHNAHAVSDFAIALILAETRNIGRLHHNMMNGIFATPRDQSNIHDLYGMTIGLVGLGYIGSLMAKKLAGFEVNIISYDPYVKPEDAAKMGVKLVDKETLFKESDFVSVHARLVPETRHMIGKNEIGLMKKTAFFINTARAGLVDTDALVEALQEHRIAGAGIDVFDEEPLPQGHPYYSLDNVTLTPHRAGVTTEATTGSPRMVVERIGNLLRGEPVTGMVNGEVAQTPEFKAWLDSVKR
ncbi:MAG: 2-hydroxyacid dehydrogenase [Lachnospiraceae bacterium]|jgi:D-3-phosphoglycerate dehydrogenase|nr:2-hydroxyacid dehydrogenase [Lachnospiraceae bacterium]